MKHSSFLSNFGKQLYDEEWVTKQLYFNEFNNKEYQRQLSILVEEGYLKHTPLLLYLANLIEKRCKENKKGICLSGSGREVNLFENKNTGPPNLCDSINISPNYVPEENIFVNDEELSVMNHTVQRLSQLVRTFGHVKKTKPRYIAKKILYESYQERNVLLQDINVLEMEFYQALSTISRKKKKRCRSKSRKRGGNKNKRP